MPLSASRNTLEKIGSVFDFPVGASTTIFAGALAVLNAGYAKPGSTATGLVAIGRAEETVTAVSAGDASIRVKSGVFQFANSASTDLIAQADVGADCYIVDDATVAKTNGSASRSRAGKIVAVDAQGVWVQVGLGL